MSVDLIVASSFIEGVDVLIYITNVFVAPIQEYSSIAFLVLVEVLLFLSNSLIINFFIAIFPFIVAFCLQIENLKYIQ